MKIHRILNKLYRSYKDQDMMKALRGWNMMSHPYIKVQAKKLKNQHYNK